LEEEDELANQSTDFEGEKGTGIFDSATINSASSGPKPGTDVTPVLFPINTICLSFCSEDLFLLFSVLDHRREKSLGLLTQNFVKLFITTNVNC
jgi:hypothetical protein